MQKKHELTMMEVSKKIKRKQILCDVSFHAASGEIVGFKGENGSGKTMLFRVTAGLIFPDKGRVLYDGKQLWKDADPVIGLMIENSSLFPDLTGYENLASLASIRKVIGAEEIKKAITKVGLDPEDGRLFKEYSLGMKQRLMMAQVIMENPEILILDEPTNGLDPDGKKLFLDLICEEASQGKIVLLSTHIEEDLAQICHRIYHVSNKTVSEMKEGL